MDKLWLDISSAPSEAWLGLLGVVFGSLLTTFGVWLTNRANRGQLRLQLEHEERIQRQRLAKERLEELYVLVCHWCNAMFGDNVHLQLVMKGHIDYNQYLDTVINTKSSDAADFSRLEMIVGIYGGQVQAAYDATLKVREKLNDIKADHKAAYRRGESGQAFLKPFSDVQLEFIKASDVLKAEITRTAREV